MFTFLKRFCALILFVVVCVTPLSAQEGTANDPFLIDETNAIDPEIKERLGKFLADERSKGRTIAVEVIQSLEAQGPERSLKGYAVNMLSDWTAELPRHATTALLVVSVDDRAAVIAMGENFAPFFIERMDRFERELKRSDFNARRLSDTVEYMVSGMSARMVPNWLPPEFRDGPSSGSSFTLGAGQIGAIALILVVIIGALWNKISASLIKMMPCEKCGARELTRTVARIREATYMSEGEDLISIRCGACGHEKTRRRKIRAHKDSNEPS